MITKIMTRQIKCPCERVLLFSLAIGMLGLMSGCGPSLANLKSREASIAKERSEIKALRSAKESAGQYHKVVKSNQGKALLISKQDIVKAFAAMFPYTYRGRDLSKQYLTGKISFVKMTDFRFLPGNRAQFKLHFDGRKIKTKKVPSYAKSQVKSLKGAVRGGSVLVEVSAFIHNSRRLLVLDPHAVGVRFNRNNTSGNKSRFLDAVNKKIFNGQKRIPLPNGLKSPVQALSTPNYLVVLPK
jgi:hypothetical protein